MPNGNPRNSATKTGRGLNRTGFAQPPGFIALRQVDRSQRDVGHRTQSIPAVGGMANFPHPSWFRFITPCPERHLAALRVVSIAGAISRWQALSSTCPPGIIFSEPEESEKPASAEKSGKSQKPSSLRSTDLPLYPLSIFSSNNKLSDCRKSSYPRLPDTVEPLYL